jgi:hypothetical protein
MPIPLGVLAVAGAGGGGGAAGNAYEHLETQILANSTTDVVTFSNLNSSYGSTYQHLVFRIVARGRDADSGTGTALRIYMNGNGGDGGGSSYATHMLRRLTTGSLGGEGYADTAYGFLGFGSAGGSGQWTGFVADLLDPFETTKNKTVRALAGVAQTSTTSTISLSSTLFKSTSAVTSVSFQFNAGWLFQTGSRFSMYGIRSS